ncbi:uncharacterized protein MYCGRDRAFT_42012 [Zymoseptoria tritici IPO323]|uniref:Rpr2-domain-containing protein n=1 Tax=Zymoseptoria tritici (strain CBS 115943 / IPO323) TaxID=336722 RepID=F9XAR4_ZYMTI|nr:uncharacterized protein MYCGRDRAFT_42012 [Zymoseptoria tritici IPO323]EGP87726.1 hypothetical protein MYCGRDRAFT_42012 [Zymoseptoria tritici IPO323]
MVKEKVKGLKGVPNKHLHARISFLHQAAEYLSSHTSGGERPDAGPSDGSSEAQPDDRDTAVKHLGSISSNNDRDSKHSTDDLAAPPLITPGMPSYMCSQLRQVALKSQIRLLPEIKRAYCKRCNAFLVEGQNYHRSMENLSRGGKKPHADITVFECGVCGAKKRFPITGAKQRRKGDRQSTRATVEISEAERNESLPLSMPAAT